MQVWRAKIVTLVEYLTIGLITAAVRTTTALVDDAVYHTERHASVTLFMTTSVDDHD